MFSPHGKKGSLASSCTPRATGRVPPAQESAHRRILRRATFFGDRPASLTRREALHESFGAVAIPSLASWLAEQQDTEAFVMRQCRLLKDESGAEPSGANAKNPFKGPEKPEGYAE